MHGEEEANKAQNAAKSIFVAGDDADMPETKLSDEDFRDGRCDILQMLVAAGFCPTRSDARRNVEQGGVSVNGEKVTDVKASFSREEIGDGVVLKKGKKNFKKIVC